MNAESTFPEPPHLDKFLVAYFDLLGTKGLVDGATFWQDAVSYLWLASKIVDETIAQEWNAVYKAQKTASVHQFSDSCFAIIRIPRFEEIDFDLGFMFETLRTCQNRLFNDLGILIRGGVAIGFGACEDWFVGGPVFQAAAQYDAPGCGPFITIDPSVIESTVRSFWSHNESSLGTTFHTFKTCDEEWANQMVYCPETDCLYLNHMRNWFDDRETFLKSQYDAILSCRNEHPKTRQKFRDLALFHNAVVSAQKPVGRWNRFIIPEETIQCLCKGCSAQTTSQPNTGRLSFVDQNLKLDRIASDAWIV